MARPENTDREPDIVLVLLNFVRVAEPSFPEDKLAAIEQQMREQYGGLRTRIPKRKKHPTSEQRRKIFLEALTDAPTEEIVSRYGISPRTLRRYIKLDHE